MDSKKKREKKKVCVGGGRCSKNQAVSRQSDSEDTALQFMKA